MKYLIYLLQYTYGLSGPKINMELFRMIGTFLWMLRLRIIRPASRKLSNVLRGTLFSGKKNKKTKSCLRELFISAITILRWCFDIQHVLMGGPTVPNSKYKSALYPTSRRLTSPIPPWTMTSPVSSPSSSLSGFSLELPLDICPFVAWGNLPSWEIFTYY